MAMKFSQSQLASQKQVQKLSQLQIQSLKYLAMNSSDLRSEIFAEAEKNPALEISSDSYEIEDFDNAAFSRPARSGVMSDYTRVGTASSAGQAKAEAYQEILESKADLRESLSEHLMQQFNLINLPKNQKILGEKLIHNLDKNGFHILAPFSFLDKVTDTPIDLEKCLDIIQNLDPVGTCCRNVEESLFIQAKSRDNAPEAALFILDGHLSFLDPPQAPRVLKRIRDFAKEESKKAFNTTDYSFIDEFDEEDIQEAIDFIKTLNPYAAGEYAPDENSFVIPDVYVDRVIAEDCEEKVEEGEGGLSARGDLKARKTGACDFKVRAARGVMPDVVLSEECLAIAGDKNVSPEQRSKMEQMVHDAKVFLESLKYREDSVFNASVAIVNFQKEFFDKGPGHLVPLRQKGLAEVLGVHETTVSRIANSKFLQCEWGLFPLKYFFVSGVAEEDNADNAVSKDKILFEIKSILDAQPAGSKKLSDQKLADMLLERGIKVARRTIAKYRSQIGMGSSYTR